jgi:DNA invertase Pin-like site-specific DNA recombinase
MACALRCPVIVSRLDRLWRNVHCITGLMEHKVHFVVAALGRDCDDFTLQIYASLAEAERRMISERIKARLAWSNKLLGLRNPTKRTKASSDGLHVPPVESPTAISRIGYGTPRCLILPLEVEETSRKAASKRPDIIRQRPVGLLIDSINYVLFNSPPPKR